MSYFMSDGSQVAQAAAGLGRMLLPPQAAAGLGEFGTRTRSFRDGILGDDIATYSDFGTRTRPFRDGIFGMRSLGQVSGSTIDLGHASVAKEVKLMLRYLNADAMPVSAIESGSWDEAAEAAYAAWAESRVDPSKMVASANGHVIPTAFGLYGLWLEAKGAAGDGYASTYWPHVTSWATGEGGPAGTVLPPTTFNGGAAIGPVKASTMKWLGAGAVVAVIAYVALRPRRRAA
jgi:hypothetical protein